MRRARWGQGLQGLLVWGLLLAALAQPALAASPPEPVQPLTSAQQLEARIDSLRKGTWNLYSQDFTQDADIRGRTLKQDVDEWMLPPAIAARLDALHTKAEAQQSAHQQAALRKTLDEATLVVQQEAYRGDLINDYWYQQTRLLEHAKIIEALQARLPEPERTGEPAAIKAARTEAAAQLSAALTTASPTAAEQQANTDRVHAALEAVYFAYNDQRGKLGIAVGQSEHTRGIAPMALVRTEPCPPAPGGTSGSAKPRISPAQGGASELYYPAELKRVDMEGRTVVSATISYTGCILKAEVLAPSGAAAFDESALKWALSAAFLPAERDQQPVQAQLRFAVQFRLRE